MVFKIAFANSAGSRILMTAKFLDEKSVVAYRNLL